MLAPLLALALAAPVLTGSDAAPAAAIETAEPAVTLSGAHFSIPGYRTGDFLTLLPALRITRSGRWWGAVVAPVHYLSFVGFQTAGLGDLVGAFGFGCFRGSELSLDVGLWTQWPSGDSHQSLGTAHLILSPQLDAGWHHDRWVARGSLAVRGAIAWGEHGLHNHQPLVAPYDLLDLRLEARAGAVLFDVLEVTARLEPVVVFIPLPTQSVGSRLSAGANAALLLGGWRAELGFAMPVTVNRAWDWQLTASLALVL